MEATCVVAKSTIVKTEQAAYLISKYIIGQFVIVNAFFPRHSIHGEGISHICVLLFHFLSNSYFSTNNQKMVKKFIKKCFIILLIVIRLSANTSGNIRFMTVLKLSMLGVRFKATNFLCKSACVRKKIFNDAFSQNTCQV